MEQNQSKPSQNSNSNDKNIQSQPLISNNIDIHQKRVELVDSLDAKQYLITSILIYSAQYFPKTRNFLHQCLNCLLSNQQDKDKNLQLIFNVSNTLSSDIYRQIIHGPSSTFIPPSQIPRMNRLDTSLFIQKDKTKISLSQIYQAHQQLKLQQMIPNNRVKQLIWYSRKGNLMNIVNVNNRFHSKQLRSQLELAGENWIDSTPLAGLFLVMKQVWKYIINIIEKYKQHIIICQKFRLLLARFSFLHNKILTNPVKQLSEDVFHHYQTYIKTLLLLSSTQSSLTVTQYIQILIQYSYCLLFYYKYKKCQKLMNKCCQILSLQMQYTGKLGRRTKYQSFDCAQLIMKLKKRTDKVQESEKSQNDKKEEQQANSLIVPEANKLVMEEINKVSQKDSNIKVEIKQSIYDQQSILLEKPKFTQTQQQVKQQQSIIITRQKLITALAMINYTFHTVPHDQMLFQYISASLSTILQHKLLLTYPLQFSLLVLRSFNDFPRIKHAQRALQQLQTLKTQYQTNNNTNKQMNKLFSTPYLNRFEFIIKLSHRYMDIQLVLTGVQLLKKVGMYEECVDGLIQRDYKEKALQLVNQIIEQKGKTPRLLCMLGDIHKNDEKYYYQAWQLSDQKYARAMRSLGWVYFNKENFQKAAECFTLATSVNYYNPNTWFTLGCCYIRLNQFQKALRPFGQSIRIDDTQGQAWGNIASCYIHLKRNKQAYSTLQQAVKHSDGNWKLWCNLLTVSLSLKQFYKFFQCIQRIIRLDHQQVITKDIYHKIQMIMKFKLYQALQGGRKRVVYNFKRRIDRLFVFMEQKIGQNSLVWEAKVNYLIVLLEYYAQLYKYYNQLHKQGKIDQNDIIDGYETLQSTHYVTQQQTSNCKTLIVQAKQTQLNMVMKIGWDQNKLESIKVKQVLIQYIPIYNKYNSKEDRGEFQLFVKGLKDKLEKCLEEKINLDLNAK